jgi:transposase
MNRPLRPLKKLPHLLADFRISLNKDKYTSVNLYFQDESRFGLMTHVGTCLTAKGVKPLVRYQQAFKSTYLFGSFSPINGDSFIWEINGVDTIVFEAYLKAFSLYKPDELKIVVIDNAGFHSTTNIDVPDNIILINIPPYSPELNPSEKIWAYLKARFKNNVFENMETLKKWLHDTVKDKINPGLIKSIVHNDFYIDTFMAQFNS